MSSSKSLLPVPSPPTRFVTHVVTSICARIAFGCASPGNCPSSSGLLLPVEVFGEPGEVEGAQQVSLGLAGLAVVVDRLVPDVEHAVPLLADVVLLGGAVDRLPAVAGRWVFHLGADAAGQGEGRQGRGGAGAEAGRVLQAVGPPCCR